MTTQVNSTVLGTLGNLTVTNDVRIGGNTLFINGGYKTLAVGSASGGGLLQFLTNGSAGPYIYNTSQNLVLWTDGGTPKITLNNAVNKSIEIVSANVDIVSGNARVSGNLTVTGAMQGPDGQVVTNNGSRWDIDIYGDAGSANNASYLGGTPAASYALTSTVIGVNQTWQNVSGSRSSGVTYTNSTTRPIFISVRWERDDGTLELTVDGLLIGRTGQTAGPVLYTLTAIVPVGSTYSATATGSGGTLFWYELR